jgi:uncharacterized oligopeptide transporter (OPT) family protein
MSEPTGLKRFLPPIGSPAYHVMLSVVAITILGPLGGISAAFMNFSIGFFVGGQVLAGILGSVVTLPYGPEGKHGANYMQTMAASVAGMCAMAVLLQAIVWLGLPMPSAWKMVLFLTCIGMFGVGVGMLYTPVLVDRMQLTFPSGYAVANILRALTDPALLRRSITKLGGGMLAGYTVGFASFKVAAIGAYGVSASTVGAGFIVGARIAIPALVVALIGLVAKPYLIEIGWLGATDPYRKIGFIISLGTILGAAGLDITLILIEAAKRFKQKTAVAPDPDWKRVNMFRLLLWIAAWGTGLVIVGSQVLHQPVYFLIIAVVLSFLFVLVNGISLGISDWNPISSAFVMGVFLMATLGLKDPGVGLMCASILLISCSVGGDMQQDRSTGWRLGTNRVNQFRYQVIGIAVGAILTVVLAKVFMSAYPILQADQFSNPHLEGAQQWQSAMTYKFVGAIKGITLEQPHIMKALWLGIGIGLAIEVIRKLIKRTAGYKAFVAQSPAGKATDFAVDAVLLPSPYASSFGGFVEIPTVLWWAGGGIFGSLYTNWAEKRKAAAAPDANALPSDMSTMSLVGGGLIAGDSLAALSVGVYGLLRTVL